MRVGAVERTYFYVTDYFSVDDIKRDPDSIRNVFAPDVCERIDEKVGQTP